MYVAHTLHAKLSLGLIMSALLLAIGGCSLGASTSSVGRQMAARVGATDTATVIPNPTVPAYLLPSAPLLPAGWTWYSNSTGHFQVPLAPGWGVGTIYSTLAGVSNCAYNVQFSPSGMRALPGIAWTADVPRLIEISENFRCPPSSWSNPPDQYTVQEPNPVTVDGQLVTLWDDDTQGQIFHYASLTFRGQQFDFSVQSRDSNFIGVDVKVFLQMLHGFAYTGS